MTTLPPPNINEFPEESIERKAYNIAESFKQYLPITNDRNRLGYNLYKYFIGEGDEPEIIAGNIKPHLEGISVKEFGEKLSDAVKNSE